MEYVILLLIILSNAIALTNILHKKIELTIPVTVIAITLIVYIAGLFNKLTIGVKIVEIIACISTIYDVIYIIKAIKTKQIKKKYKRILTPRIIYLHCFILSIYYHKS